MKMQAGSTVEAHATSKPTTATTPRSPIRPLPGNAVVALESHFVTDGSIVLPENLRNRRGYAGTVLAIAHTADSLKAWNRADITGRRVLLQPYGGRDVTPDHAVQVFAVADILADVTDAKPEELDAITASVASPMLRCRYCGPAIKGNGPNMLLVQGPRGMECPRCGRDQNGDK